MTLKEYIAMQTLGTVFANYNSPTDYGFESHYSMYRVLIQNEFEALISDDGDELKVVAEYEHRYIPELLKDTYSYIEYLFDGIKTFSVEI